MKNMCLEKIIWPRMFISTRMVTKEVTFMLHREIKATQIKMGLLGSLVLP